MEAWSKHINKPYEILNNEKNVIGFFFSVFPKVWNLSLR